MSIVSSLYDIWEGVKVPGPELSYFLPGQDPELVQLAKAEVDKWIAENGVKEYEYHDGDKRDKNVSRSQTGVKTAPKLPSSVRIESFFFLKSIRLRRRLSGLNHFTPVADGGRRDGRQRERGDLLG